MPGWEWAWPPAMDVEDVVLVAIAALLVLMSGLMSGLTLGLMSLDKVDMELLKRTGTEHEKRMAARITPIISNQHYLLVTLLMCNAVAMEGLPLVLDRLADPWIAVLISVSVVLVFGEIVPQAVCSRCAAGPAAPPGRLTAGPGRAARRGRPAR
jgi:metal transporter CNNM